jgi:Viral BACON domain
VAEPRALTFRLPPGESTPSAQTITIGSTSKILNYTASADSGSWLAVGPQLGSTSGSTSGSNTVSVAVNPANLPAGIQTGFISVTAPGAAEALTIPVTVNPGPNAASGVNAALSVDRTNVTLQGPLSGPAQTQSIHLTSTVNEPYVASALGSVWLSVSPATGSTPATLVVTADPSFLSSAGTYIGYLQIYSPGNNDLQYVQVTYNVTTGGAGNAFAATPSSVPFTQILGGTTPSPQTVQLSSTTATSFTAAISNATWLTVTPTSGTTPATLTLSVNTAGLSASTYLGSIAITGGATAVTIPVPLTVSSSGITATPSSVSASRCYAMSSSIRSRASR